MASLQNKYVEIRIQRIINWYVGTFAGPRKPDCSGRCPPIWMMGVLGRLLFQSVLIRPISIAKSSPITPTFFMDTPLSALVEYHISTMAARCRLREGTVHSICIQTYRYSIVRDEIFLNWANQSCACNKMRYGLFASYSGVNFSTQIFYIGRPISSATPPPTPPRSHV